jgi:hypothetical protein
VTVDEDFDELLRHRLHAQEPAVSTSSDLAPRLIATGSANLRRRRRKAVGLSALVTAAVVAGSSLLASRLANPEGPPAAGRTPGQNQPSGEGAEAISAGAWADQLPRGAEPDVAFLAGTILHLANGAAVDLEGDAGLIGQTVAGVVVLVEGTDERGHFVSRYVLVEDDGDVVDMPVSSLRGGSAQDELVSPDGRYFTSGGPVIDKATGDIVDEMPKEAIVLEYWTPSGITYLARGGAYYLWQLGGTPQRLDGFPGGYPNGTDIGLRRQQGGCTDVVRIDPTGRVTGVGQECLPQLFAVSPDGARGLTTTLEVVDTATGTTTRIAEQPISGIDRIGGTYWEDEDTVLIPIPGTRTDTGLLVRCDLQNFTCERATDSFPVDPGEPVQLP